MSINFRIGPVVLELDEFVGYTIKEAKVPYQPCFKLGMANGTNSLGFSNDSFEKFLRATCLHTLFRHPIHGIALDEQSVYPLTVAHLNAVKHARLQLESMGGLPPGFGDPDVVDYNLAMLIIIEDLMGYALATAKFPGIMNF